jgi:hypothetical protein
MVLMDRENEHIGNDVNRNSHNIHIHMNLGSTHIENDVNLNLHNVHRDLETNSKMLSRGKDTLEELRSINRLEVEDCDADIVALCCRDSSCKPFVGDCLLIAVHP